MDVQRDNTDESRIVQSFLDTLRRTVGPGWHGEIVCRVSVVDGQFTHVKTGAEQNQKLRDLRK